VLLVTPGSVAVPEEPPQAASAMREAARTAERGPILAIEFLLLLMKMSHIV
jgi:hypothetical protein